MDHGDEQQFLDNQTHQQIQQLHELLDGAYPGVGADHREIRRHAQIKALILIAEKLSHIDFRLAEIVEILLEEEEPVESGQAVSAHLTIGGSSKMPGAINVDTTNETVTLAFYDDKQNVTSAPDGAQVTFTSDNEGVATVAADPANPLQGDVSPVAPGSANIGANLTDANGQPLMEPDGVTPFSVAAVAVTVSPGPAESAGLVLSA